jgi:hypothetical protein
MSATTGRDHIREMLAVLNSLPRWKLLMRSQPMLIAF